MLLLLTELREELAFFLMIHLTERCTTDFYSKCERHPASHLPPPTSHTTIPSPTLSLTPLPAASPHNAQVHDRHPHRAAAL